MTAKKLKGISPNLESAISKLLEEVMTESEDVKHSLNDKVKVIDRALKLEQVRLKISDEEWGSGFLPPEEPEEAEE